MDVVSELRRGLTERIGRERFDLWFKTGVRLALRHNAVAVAVSDQFILERLRKQFLPDLRSVAQRLLGQAPQVEFFVDASLRSAPPAEQADEAQGEETAAGPATAPMAATEPPRRASNGRPAAARRFARLDSFVAGAGNRIALTAAQTVVERPGAISPLFVHGPTGCGKTHLLEGIWSAVRRQNRSRRALFLSAEQFTSHFLEALRGGGLPSFRHKSREVDLLVVDDVQFFAGKRATIIELQHTLDALLRQGRQLVLAADRPPGVLPDFGPEFAARIAGGLVCGIEEADFPTRCGIAQRAAARLPMPVPEDVLRFVADQLPGDGRQIAGALHRLDATSAALGQPLSLELARQALQDLVPTRHRLVQLPDIEKAVCSAFGLSPKALRDGRKTKAVTHPRMLAMWLARKYTRAASSEISHYFGRRSHSTVISAERKVNRWVSDGATVQVGHGSCKVSDAIRQAEMQLRTG